MKIEFSEHALDQLNKRPTISKETVLETIKNPEQTLRSYKGEYFIKNNTARRFWRL